MAESLELKTVKGLVKGISDVTFSNYAAAQIVQNLDPVIQKRLAELLRAVAEISAINLDYGNVTDDTAPYLLFYEGVRQIPLTGSVR